MKKYLMKKRFFALLTVAALGSSCASLDPELLPTAQPEKETAYLAGITYSTSAERFGMVVQNTRTMNRYALPLSGNVSSLPTLSDRVSAIRVPEGEYKVIGWSGDSQIMHTVDSGQSPSSALLQSFYAGEGSVIVLGRFILDSSVDGRYSLSPVQHNRIRTSSFSVQEARDAFAARYPQLPTKAFSCLTCNSQ